MIYDFSIRTVFFDLSCEKAFHALPLFIVGRAVFFFYVYILYIRYTYIVFSIFRKYKTNHLNRSADVIYSFKLYSREYDRCTELIGGIGKLRERCRSPKLHSAKHFYVFHISCVKLILPRSNQIYLCIKEKASILWLFFRYNYFCWYFIKIRHRRYCRLLEHFSRTLVLRKKHLFFCFSFLFLYFFSFFFFC